MTIGYVYRERIFQLRRYIKYSYKLKVRLVIECAKTLNEATVYSHCNKTNKYITGTKVKPLDLGLTQQLFCVLEAVRLIWLDVAVVVDVLAEFFQDVDGLTCQLGGECLVARWVPLSRVIADCAVYVKFLEHGYKYRLKISG